MAQNSPECTSSKSNSGKLGYGPKGTTCHQRLPHNPGRFSETPGSKQHHRTGRADGFSPRSTLIPHAKRVRSEGARGGPGGLRTLEGQRREGCGCRFCPPRGHPWRSSGSQLTLRETQALPTCLEWRSRPSTEGTGREKGDLGV